MNMFRHAYICMYLDHQLQNSNHIMHMIKIMNPMHVLMIMKT